jgi:hypothetical protein
LVLAWRHHRRWAREERWMTDAHIAMIDADTRLEAAPGARGRAGACAYGETRAPDTFDLEYLESGPEARRLSLTCHEA